EGEELSKPKEDELKFEWLKGAPKEGYTKDLNLETHAQPFGIPVRNVRCIKCHKWGHVNTDRECPLYNKSISTEPSSLTDAGLSDPVKLMQDMRNDGFALKQNALGRVLNKDDPNQQILASDEDDDDDPELAFLATLNEKQKRKLLRKLDKLENKEQEKRKHKSKKKRKHSESEDERESKSKRKKKRKLESSECESSDDGHARRRKRKQEKDKRDKNGKDKRNNRSDSRNHQEDRSYSKR
ncbi:Hypothetical predicted protein, partial [Paramuricea clavata]